MKRRDFTKLAATTMVAATGSTLAAKQTKPNLLIFQTDEHNFRTLGCYRDLMSEDQAFVWGKGVKVDTPHIDSIARDGAICDRYYSSSPVCSPSRASFVSGLYPINTNVYKNGIPLKEGLVTFAEVLKQQGYSTSYLGKWHLEGIKEKPGFAPKRKFGFDDNRYMWDGGHWKKMGLKEDGSPYVASIGSNGKVNTRVDGADEKSFTTDWLADRTMEIIERDQHKPFCIMCSIPDPHTPNTVRAPYDTMFKDLHFKNPKTMDWPLEKMPKWHRVGQKNTCLEIDQDKFQQYFGMVKCIDDNVGRVLGDLKAKGLDQNTIVIFTSDHGDMLGEHKRTNKSMPFEASARIPFVIRYPKKIRPGKVIHTAYTTVDFAPTILGMMGISETIPNAEGIDGSSAFLSKELEVNDDRITYVTSAHQNAVTAVNQRYKLVLTPIDDPWLFDLEKDPDELINQYPKPEYKEIGQRMKTALMNAMKRANEPMLVSPKKPLIVETRS
ncbi:sulfatase family protein [Pontiella agarivorans]|uniref:Sulfatase n=1 Tax=Pontiella agarivorans TaxID=3038953 RepID=A0ABU5N1C8_9BACT|nr:sulfatase [Pontiella agarivorans]MDZ8120240.1 sulfatase [Pontiella agarivorans]